MTSRRIGIALGRREGSVVGLEFAGATARVAFSYHLARTADLGEPSLLAALLTQLPAPWHSASIAIALSPGALACSDYLRVPYRKERQIQSIARSLAEGCCAGEICEDLAVDVTILSQAQGERPVAVLAISQDLLKELRETVKRIRPKASVETISAIPVALYEALSLYPSSRASSERRSEAVGAPKLLLSAGEAFLLPLDPAAKKGWRAFPLNDAQEGAGTHSVEEVRGMLPTLSDCEIYSGSDLLEMPGGVQIESRYAAAAAIAQLEPRERPNLLRGAPDAPLQTRERLLRPFFGALTAAILFCTCAGLFFEFRLRDIQAQQKEGADYEEKLWATCFPGRHYRPQGLSEALREERERQAKDREANGTPSALSFWSAIGAVWPDPNPLGLTLESLQLGLLEGRLTARLPSTPGDLLLGPAQLEQALNRSSELTARGEFEAQTNATLVRMRLDYHPQVGESGRKP